MQTTLDGVGVVHDAYPGAETGVGQTVPEPGHGVGDHQDRKGRVRGQDGVGDDVTYRGHDGDPTLTESGVDAGVGEGGQRVAGEGGQEDE